jgi:hypothetical protein
VPCNGSSGRELTAPLSAMPASQVRPCATLTAISRAGVFVFFSLASQVNPSLQTGQDRHKQGNRLGVHSGLPLCRPTVLSARHPSPSPGAADHNQIRGPA